MTDLVNTIDKEEAIKLTTAWRNFYSAILKSQNENGPEPNPDGEDIFRGFMIPIEDFNRITDLHGKSPDFVGVRAYLAKGTINSGIFQDTPPHLLLVPVFKSDEIVGEFTPNGKDMLEQNTDGKTLSTIYDFTTPCPAICDPQSVLYGKK